MSSSYRSLIILALLSSNVHANEIFAEALYWRASENIDWVYANDMHPPAQNITYKTLSFEYDPNFRVGVSAEDNYYRSLTYTRFYTHGSDAVFGNTISGFLSDRIAHFPNSLVYQAGQIEFKINYNIFDLDIGKRFNLGKRLSWLPVLGLRGGWIKQSYDTDFQGSTNATETVKNNFTGLGPKVGLNSLFALWCLDDYHIDLFANFSASFLWGHWEITDDYSDTSPAEVTIIVPSRDFGAFTSQAIIGLSVDYCDVNIKLGYEIMDWFDQCQFYDNGSGGHTNDLILQGWSLRFAVNFC